MRSVWEGRDTDQISPVTTWGPVLRTKESRSSGAYGRRVRYGIAVRFLPPHTAVTLADALIRLLGIAGVADMNKTIKIASLIVFVVFLAAAVFYGTRKATMNVYANQPISTRPYVMFRDNFRVEAGKEVFANRDTIAQRQDGALVRVMVNPKDGSTVRRIDDPSHDYVGMWFDKLKLKSTGHPPTNAIAVHKQQIQNPPQNCLFGVYEFVDGEDVLLGHKALRIIQQVPSGLDRQVSWRFAEFGCVTVQSYHQARLAASAEWATTDGTRLMAFAAQEPDTRLFSDAVDYSEVKPSDTRRRMMLDAGIDEKKCKDCLVNEPDDDVTYRQWQKPSYTP